MKKCCDCGKVYDDKAIFCEVCGSLEFEEPKTERFERVERTAPASYAPPPKTASAYYAPPSKTAPSKKARIIITTIAITIFFLAAAFTAVVFIVQNNNRSIQKSYLSDDGLLRFTEYYDGYMVTNEAAYDETELVIPSEFNGKPVSSINSSFASCHRLESLTIPFVGASLDESRNGHFGYIFGANSSGENILYVPTTLREVVITGGSRIDDYAFRGCRGLVTVAIADSVKEIGFNAFADCFSIKKLTVPFVGAVQNGVYGYNSHFGYIFGAINADKNKDEVQPSLREVIVTGGSSIDKDAFYGCYKLTSITLPKSIRYIGDSAFQECNALTYINIPNGVEEIGQDAFKGTRVFENAYNLANILYLDGWVIGTDGTLDETVMINGGTKGIAGGAFFGCAGVTEVYLPDSLVTIGSAAFFGCSDLVSIDLNNVTHIGAKAFKETGIWNNAPDDSIIYIGEWVVGYKGDVYYGQITLLDCTTRIADRAFYACYGLTSLVMPDSVIDIGSYAFYDCIELESIVLSKNIRSIGGHAFEKCTALSYIVIPQSVSYIGESAFYNWSKKQEIGIYSRNVMTEWNKDWNWLCYAEIFFLN